MKRLIIFICVVLIAAVGMAGAGCQGGTGAIEFPDAVDSTAALEEGAATGDVVPSSAQGVTTCDPVVITNTVIEVVGGDEDLAAEPEGQTCLMSRVPDDVSFVISVLKGARDIGAVIKDAFPQASQEITEEELAEKREVLGKFMMPFDERGLEEVVGFGKFKYVDGVMEKMDDACRLCMKQNLPTCLPTAMTECGNNVPAPDDFERCAWEMATEGGIISECDDWSSKCYDKCSEEKPEPESFGVLVRWLLSNEGADGAIELAKLDEFRMDINKQSLESAVKEWHERCDSPNTCDPTDLEPTSLDPEKSMRIKQIDPTVALVYLGTTEPALIEPVRICNFIRFDGIRTRSPVYGELKDMRLLMKVKADEAFTAETRDSKKLVAGIDLRDSHYRLYAGVVDKQTLATGAFLSSVINLGDNFGMELWKQMMLRFVQ